MMHSENSRLEKLFLWKYRWLALLLIVAMLIWYIHGIVEARNRAEQHIEELFFQKMDEVHFNRVNFAISEIESYLSEGGSEFVKRKKLEWVANDLEEIVIGNYMDDFGWYYRYIDEKSDFNPAAYEELFTTYANLARMWSEAETLPERATVELYLEEVARLGDFFKVSDTGELDPESDSQVAGRSTYRDFGIALGALVEQIELPYIKENLSYVLYRYGRLESPNID
ncbi:hypothetical protein ACR6HW_13090 [Fusibacter sp. JL298sf-3]